MQIKFPTGESEPQFSLMTFFWNQKERVLMAIAVVFLSATFLAKGFIGKEKRLEDYFQAGMLHSKIKAGKEIDDAALEKLLKSHAELKPVFSAFLEQEAVLKGDLKKAKSISFETLKRLSFMSPHYQEFARISLMIEEKKYEEALILSKLLDAQLSKESSPNLNGLNLVRIAFLESFVNKSETSYSKWEQIKDSISNELYTHLCDEQLTLLDFARIL